MKTVRIQRKRKSNLTMSLNWLNLLTLGLRWAIGPYIDQDKAIIAQARLEKTRKDTELAEVRKQVMMDEVVIRDLKIEKEKIQLEFLEYKAKMLGLRPDENWTCPHCGTVNTPMVKACTACGAKK